MKNKILSVGIACTFLLITACSHKGQEITSLNLPTGHDIAKTPGQQTPSIQTAPNATNPSTGPTISNLPPPAGTTPVQPVPPGSSGTGTTSTAPAITAVEIETIDAQGIVLNYPVDISQTTVPTVTIPAGFAKIAFKVTPNDPGAPSFNYNLKLGATALVTNNTNGVLDVGIVLNVGITSLFDLSVSDSETAGWSWSRNIPVFISTSVTPPPTASQPPQVGSISWVVNYTSLCAGATANGTLIAMDLTQNSSPVIHVPFTTTKLCFKIHAEGNQPLTYKLSSGVFSQAILNSDGVGLLYADSLAFQAGQSLRLNITITDPQQLTWNKDIVVSVGMPPPTTGSSGGGTAPSPRPQCTHDSDCNSGQFCGGETCISTLAQGAPCRRDEECSGQLVCTNDFCAPALYITQPPLTIELLQPIQLSLSKTKTSGVNDGGYGAGKPVYAYCNDATHKNYAISAVHAHISSIGNIVGLSFKCDDVNDIFANTTTPNSGYAKSLGDNSVSTNPETPNLPQQYILTGIDWKYCKKTAEDSSTFLCSLRFTANPLYDWGLLATDRPLWFGEAYGFQNDDSWYDSYCPSRMVLTGVNAFINDGREGTNPSTKNLITDLNTYCQEVESTKPAPHITSVYLNNARFTFANVKIGNQNENDTRFCYIGCPDNQFVTGFLASGDREGLYQYTGVTPIHYLQLYCSGWKLPSGAGSEPVITPPTPTQQNCGNNSSNTVQNKTYTVFNNSAATGLFALGNSQVREFILFSHQIDLYSSDAQIRVGPEEYITDAIPWSNPDVARCPIGYVMTGIGTTEDDTFSIFTPSHQLVGISQIFCKKAAFIMQSP